MANSLHHFKHCFWIDDSWFTKKTNVDKNFLGRIFFMVKLACIGGIIFCLAIAPLGVGSAFPATVSMAIAFYILLIRYEHDFIWKWKQYQQQIRIKVGSFVKLF